MRWSRLLALALLGLMLVFSACAPQAAPPAVAPPAPAAAAASQPKVTSGAPREAWQEEWENILARSPREGKVVIYSTAGSTARVALSNAFSSKYGITLEFVMGKSEEINERMLRERSAGLYLVDVLLAGNSPTLNQLKPAKVLEPLEPVLILSEVRQEGNWWGGKLPWVDKERTMLSSLAYPTPAYAINTTMVKAEELPSWRSLLEPRWKGKISINDPTVGGAGLAWFSVVGEKLMSYDYMRELAKQEPVIIRDWRLQVEWLAHGKYPIAIAPKSDPITEFMQAGAPVKFVMPKEGTGLTTGSGGLSLIKNAPHPNAARLFINWLLSKEGLTAFTRSQLAESARLDVPTDFLPSEKKREPVVNYFPRETEEFLSRQPEHIKMAKEIFGPLIK